MSLLSSFITNHLLTALEAEFVSHEPQIQAQFLVELEQALSDIGAWMESKISPPVVDPAQ